MCLFCVFDLLQEEDAAMHFDAYLEMWIKLHWKYSSTHVPKESFYHHPETTTTTHLTMNT